MRDRALIVTGCSVIVGMVFMAVSGVRNVDTREAPLYERLGGEVRVEGMVNRFLAKVAGDDRLGVPSAGLDMDWLRALLDEWVCDAGGPCDTDAQGRSRADEDVDLTDDVFDLVTHHFADAMSDAGVGAHEHFAAMRLFVDMLTMFPFHDE